ncbi:MAG: hypothetical protein WC523_04640 [Patescibacteria group bacterium]
MSLSWWNDKVAYMYRGFLERKWKIKLDKAGSLYFKDIDESQWTYSPYKDNFYKEWWTKYAVNKEEKT